MAGIQMKLRLLGQRNILGGGVLFANLVDALRNVYFPEKVVEEVDLFEEAQFEHAVSAASAQDINVWTWPDDRVKLLKGTQIVWAMFESDRLPPHYVRFLNAEVDFVWVPSGWGRDVLIANGVASERVDIVPLGVDANAFHTYMRRNSDRSRPFRFLAVGKFEERKGYNELLKAFTAAFGNSADVQLVIKADYFLDFENKKKVFAEMVASFGISNVRLMEGNWAREQLFGLYSCCDAFVFPSRSEAWGLPAIEAVATGLPIISTFYSGHTEFLQFVESSLFKISTTLQPIDDPEYQRHWPSDVGDYGRWAQPSVASIADGLTTTQQRHSRMADAALNNSLLVRERFSWNAAANKALDHLKRRGLIPLAFTFPE
jgi:glycosyltransferase involved in cell wall biosynthesis